MSHGSPDPLERRLVELAAGGTPDWSDVERRAGRFEPAARARRVLLIAAALLALFVAVAAASGLGSRMVDLLSVSRPTTRDVPRPAAVPYVFGDKLSRPGKPALALSERLFAPLLGNRAPLAILSPDGRFLAYHSWRSRTPSLRVVDLRTGRDDLLARGAQSLAWRDRIAYVRGTRQVRRNGSAYLGRVVVAEQPGAHAVVWTPEPARYRVVAWAGQALLVHVDACDVPPCDAMPGEGVYALTRPGHMRRLSVRDIAAVSPDGRFVVGPYERIMSDGPTTVVHVDDVRSGRTVASLDLSRLRTIAGAGGLSTASWRGDTIVGVTTGAAGALVVLDFDGRTLRFDRALDLDRAARAGFEWAYLLNPTFAGAGTGRIVVQLEGERRGGGHLATTLTCDLDRRSCVRGRTLPPRRWLALVTNPSRPLD